MLARIDFNCDLGEGCDDAAVLPFISSANIACGAHAGDADTMRRTLDLCLRHGVAIGAHPSFDDREHFGRREIVLAPTEIRALVARQMETLIRIADERGARVAHVKPHGALYNLAAGNESVAAAIAQAVHAADANLYLVGLSGSALPAAGESIGLRVLHEVFAERRYEADGTLTPRTRPDAVIDDLNTALAQVRGIACDGVMIARTGQRVAVRADTLCLHGDRPDAAEFACTVRALLDAEGVRVEAPR